MPRKEMKFVVNCHKVKIYSLRFLFSYFLFAHTLTLEKKMYKFFAVFFASWFPSYSQSIFFPFIANIFRITLVIFISQFHLALHLFTAFFCDDHIFTFYFFLYFLCFRCAIPFSTLLPYFFSHSFCDLPKDEVADCVCVCVISLIHTHTRSLSRFLARTQTTNWIWNIVYLPVIIAFMSFCSFCFVSVSIFDEHFSWPLSLANKVYCVFFPPPPPSFSPFSSSCHFCDDNCLYYVSSWIMLSRTAKQWIVKYFIFLTSRVKQRTHFNKNNGFAHIHDWERKKAKNANGSVQTANSDHLSYTARKKRPEVHNMKIIKYIKFIFPFVSSRFHCILLFAVIEMVNGFFFSFDRSLIICVCVLCCQSQPLKWKFLFVSALNTRRTTWQWRWSANNIKYS